MIPATFFPNLLQNKLPSLTMHILQNNLVINDNATGEIQSSQWYEINKQELAKSCLTFLIFQTAYSKTINKNQIHDDTNRHFKIDEASFTLIYVAQYPATTVAKV
jgi:hypothetical protein